MTNQMNVVNILPRLSTAEYALRKEEVGNALYDIMKRIPLHLMPGYRYRALLVKMHTKKGEH